MKFKLLLIFLFLAGCAIPHKSHINRELANAQIYDRVIVIGAATQGNGYNWSSTVSWLGVKMMDVAEQAQLAANRGERVGIKVANFIGGSSGSGVTLLLDGFLQNKELLSNSPLASERIYSIEDIRRLSKALTFSSMAFDFHWFFKGSTLLRVAKRNILSVLDQISDLVPIIPDFIGKGRKRMWLSKMNGQDVVSDFAKFIYFASTVTWEQIQTPIIWDRGEFKGLSPSMMETASGKDIATSLKHFYSLPMPENEVSLSEKDLKILRKMTKAQSVAARGVLTRLAKGAFKKYGKKQALYRVYNARPKNVEKQTNPYRSIMSEQVGTGQITVSMAARFKDKKAMSKSVRSDGLPYKSLRPHLFMSEKTAKNLLTSIEYQKLIQSGDEYLNRYVILVVNNRWAAINPSVREPGLLGEYAGEMKSKRFRITKVYDPRSDKEFNFQLTDIKAEPNQYMFVAGGFPYEEMSLLIGSLYLSEEVSKLENRFGRVQPMYFMFGNPLNEDNPEVTFAFKSIKGIFNSSETEEEANANAKDWIEWANHSKSIARNKIFPKYHTTFFETRFDWSTGSLPSAISGTSRILVHNAAVEAAKSNVVIKLKSVYSLYPPSADK